MYYTVQSVEPTGWLAGQPSYIYSLSFSVYLSLSLSLSLPSSRLALLQRDDYSTRADRHITASSLEVYDWTAKQTETTREKTFYVRTQKPWCASMSLHLFLTLKTKINGDSCDTFIVIIACKMEMQKREHVNMSAVKSIRWKALECSPWQTSWSLPRLILSIIIRLSTGNPEDCRSCFRTANEEREKSLLDQIILPNGIAQSLSSADWPSNRNNWPCSISVSLVDTLFSCSCFLPCLSLNTQPYRARREGGERESVSGGRRRLPSPLSFKASWWTLSAYASIHLREKSKRWWTREEKNWLPHSYSFLCFRWTSSEQT